MDCYEYLTACILEYCMKKGSNSIAEYVSYVPCLYNDNNSTYNCVGAITQLITHSVMLVTIRVLTVLKK